MIATRLVALILYILVGTCASFVSEAQTQMQSTTAEAMTNADVVQMVKAGISETTVLLAIQRSKTTFDTSPSALVSLKTEGVSDAILNAMLSVNSNSANSFQPVIEASEPKSALEGIEVAALDPTEMPLYNKYKQVSDPVNTGLVRITRVKSDTPAVKAGLRVGDWITVVINGGEQSTTPGDDYIYPVISTRDRSHFYELAGRCTGGCLVGIIDTTDQQGFTTAGQAQGKWASGYLAVGDMLPKFAAITSLSGKFVLGYRDVKTGRSFPTVYSFNATNEDRVSVYCSAKGGLFVPPAAGRQVRFVDCPGDEGDSTSQRDAATRPECRLPEATSSPPFPGIRPKEIVANLDGVHVTECTLTTQHLHHTYLTWGKEREFSTGKFVVVERIDPESPAFKARIKVGDLVYAVVPGGEIPEAAKVRTKQQFDSLQSHCSRGCVFFLQHRGGAGLDFTYVGAIDASFADARAPNIAMEGPAGWGICDRKTRFWYPNNAYQFDKPWFSPAEYTQSKVLAICGPFAVGP